MQLEFLAGSSNPREAHYNTAKWILMYLKGTYRSCTCFGSGDHVLQGYIGAYYVGDEDSRKFTPGYLVTYAGNTVMAIKVPEMHFAVNERCKVHCSG
jgi:hypothetical protein